ncbi:MAG: phosphate/phosphite/phosphonate ABC transporter substrate-binding protein [Magnetospirillum gryphiswaldense]|nr:phosphate/phosphite/phosphonate ABC transporter substrate-binding protein [Magnetospirillum gryphiswaldense]
MRKGVGSLLLLWLWSAPVAAADSLVFGVTPQQSAGRLAENWVPLLEEIGRRLGGAVIFRTAPDTQEFERRTLAGEFDVVYASPVLYLAAVKALGARAIARQRQDEQGVLVVRADSPLNHVGQLSGQVVAFPAASAFGGTLLTQAALKHRGIQVQARNLSSDDSVYRAVLDGAAAAGGGVLRTLERQPAEIRGALRAVLTTEAFPAYPIFVLPRMGRAKTAHLQAVLFSLDDDQVGRDALQRAALRGIALADDTTYDPVRPWSVDAVQAVLREAAP